VISCTSGTAFSYRPSWEFHGQRVTFITELACAGDSPIAVQKLNAQPAAPASDFPAEPVG